MHRIAHIILLLLLVSAITLAQDEPNLQSDSLQTGTSLEIGAAEFDVVQDSLEEKSAMGAVLRSAILPSWGQFYNESYWKVPIVLGISGYLIYSMIAEHQNFLDYSDLYDASITEDAPSGDLLLKRYREFYRDNRDTYGWWMLVTYLLQLADAYVDAALFSFDVSPESSITLLPRAGGVGVQWRF
jgi:hypothetical protein